MNYPTGEDLPEPWATWIPTRMPQFKIHSSISTAKSALTNASTYDDAMTRCFKGGVLYRYNGTQWVVCEIIRPGSARTDYPLFTRPKLWIKQPGITTVISENPYS